jgi:hypothetical protein
MDVAGRTISDVNHSQNIIILSMGSFSLVQVFYQINHLMELINLLFYKILLTIKVKIMLNIHLILTGTYYL